MPLPRYLQRAPIQEALIDLRAEATTFSDPHDVDDVADSLRERFPLRRAQHKTESRIQLRDGKLVSEPIDSGFLGVMLTSADRLTVAQFRRNGFTLNRLRPYVGWAEFSAQAMELWAAYLTVAKPTHVDRLALRYINRLELPCPLGTDFSEFLRSAPEVPPELPQTIGAFRTFVTIVDAEQEIFANVIQNLDQVTDEGMTILLDIDVYRNKKIETSAAAIAPILELLRDFKNRVFFESLTEDALRHYE